MVKQLTTISEFDTWQAYFARRMSDRDKDDWYAAATIRAIFASQASPKAKIPPVSDYLLEFRSPETKNDPAEGQDSKAIWASIFGMDFA